ncbi:MAG TPA: hypothetical protein DIT74_01355, partial [Pseudoalteromonas sp.]|nr:hypothetical protein [Pseudoalteromonas sp.]
MSQLDSSRPAPVQKSYDLKVWLVFLIPSLIGVFLFMTPVPSGEIMTIPIAVMAKAIQASFSEIALGLIATIICITGVMSLVFSVFKPKSLTKFRLLNHLFNVSWIWLVTRLFGMAFVLLTYFQVGPHAITSENTGLLVLKDLLPVLFSVFILAGLLLPLLLNFGLLELVGTLLTKVMR